MLNNIYILEELSKYLNSEIKEFCISKIFTQEKSNLVICLNKPISLQSKYLVFNSENLFPYLYIKRNYERARKNTVDLFEYLNSSVIKDIGLYDNDRVIKINLNDGFALLFSFITSKINFIVLKRNIISDAFKNKNKIQNQIFKKFISPQKTDIYKKNNIKNVGDYLKTKCSHLGQILQNEIYFRTGLDKNTLFDSDIKDKINTVISEVIKFSGSKTFLIYRKNNVIIPSVFILTHLYDYDIKKYENINDLLTDYIIEKMKNRKTEETKKNLHSYLKKQLNKAENSINNIKSQLIRSNSISEYINYGNHILAGKHLINKGDIIFKSINEKGETVNISLKPNLTPVENAEWYFTKYKKVKSAINELKYKIDVLEFKKSELLKKIQELEKVNNIKKLKKMNESNKAYESETLKLFRKFFLNENFEVWVGKNSSSNDKLTTKYSSPDDLWFHVRGASGSHTVLKIHNRNNIPSSEIIEITAGIAAYYSKARNAKRVPVAYCKRKYVKKKKGLKEGSVVMEKEKVVFIKPGLPVS